MKQMANDARQSSPTQLPQRIHRTSDSLVIPGGMAGKKGTRRASARMKRSVVNTFMNSPEQGDGAGKSQASSISATGTPPVSWGTWGGVPANDQKQEDVEEEVLGHGTTEPRGTASISARPMTKLKMLEGDFNSSAAGCTLNLEKVTPLSPIEASPGEFDNPKSSRLPPPWEATQRPGSYGSSYSEEEVLPGVPLPRE